MFGQILLYILFGTSLVTALAYFIGSSLNKEKLVTFGRYMYYGMTGGLLAMATFLMYNILTHNFQFTYIWSYSSKTLPLHLLFSSFYAGQEGSFLLWTLFTAIVGIAFLPYARKNGYEPLTIGMFSLIILFLLLIMIFKSPFLYIWESFPDQNLQIGFMPPEGRGLNPILQNYWIAIHPPILFLGYSLMTIPFVLAVAALIKRDYTGWVKVAIPWTLFASAVLGLGIMLGGFWAYETLGWGGFWAWDPVENASLHPWLVAVALAHTFLVQRSTGGLIKTNIALSIIGFVLVLFATYLTRSGILGEASVHSFVDPGQIVNTLLIALLLVFTLGGIFLLLFRMKDMPQTKVGFKFSSKEMWLSLGSILLLALTVIVIIGTIRPVLPEFIVKTKAALKPEDFNRWASPISILILILNAISIYLNWRGSNWRDVLKKLIIPVALSAVAVIITIFFGVHDIEFIILGFTAWFSFFVNIELIIRNIKTNPKRIGSFLSHLGISALILGVIASGVYSTTKPLALSFKKPVEAFGYQFTLENKERIEKDLKDREKYKYNIAISRNGSVSKVAPIVYWSDFNNFESPFFEPGIDRNISNDVYLSPKTWEFDKMQPLPVLKKGDSVRISFDTNLVIRFKTFDMLGQNHAGHNNSFMFGIVVEYEKFEKKTLDTLLMEIDMATSRMNPIQKEIPGTDLQIMIAGYTPNEDMAKTQIELMIGRETFFVDASIKQYINLVWLGVIAVVFGFIISIIRHTSKTIKEKKQENELVSENVSD
jgi:cytochrome c-type biogenesis protein CcmF